MLQEKGHEAIKSMGPVERIVEEDARAGEYQHEFFENGLKNLVLSTD